MNGSYGQFVVVLIIFIGVLAVTLFVTRWLSGYQKGIRSSSNIELIESASLAAGKYVQIVRVGDRYVALAVSKDSVTRIAELDKDSLILRDGTEKPLSFKSILSRAGSISAEDSDNENEK